MDHIRLGLRANWQQFTLLIIINGFVGGMVGLERSILPQLATEEFHLAAKSGIQFSSLNREGPAINLKASDTGFYAGAVAGVKVGTKECLFPTVEYEWVNCPNNYYDNGFVNSAMAGIGYRF